MVKLPCRQEEKSKKRYIKTLPLQLYFRLASRIHAIVNRLCLISNRRTNVRHRTGEFDKGAEKDKRKAVTRSANGAEKDKLKAVTRLANGAEKDKLKAVTRSTKA